MSVKASEQSAVQSRRSALGSPASRALTISERKFPDNRGFNLKQLLAQASLTLNHRIVAALEIRGHADFQVEYLTVFSSIESSGTPLSAIAERASLGLDTMHELVRALHSGGYLERQPSTASLDGTVYALTDDGWHFMLR